MDGLLQQGEFADTAEIAQLSLPKIISARIRAMRQNQRMIRHDAVQN
jgi:hypothetical protein